MINQIVIRCLAGIVGLFGLFLVGAGALTVWQGIRMSAWPGVEGVITASRLEERHDQVHRSDDTARTEVSFVPVVEYRYTVNGTDYTGHRISPAETRYARPLAQKVLDRYPVGAQVQVRHDPQDPAEAFLRVGTSWAGLGFVAIGAALAAAAIWMWTHVG
jgi:hypothetical protein